MNDYYVLCQITASNYEQGDVLPRYITLMGPEPTALTSIPLDECIQKVDDFVSYSKVAQDFVAYEFKFATDAPTNAIEESYNEFGAIDTFEDYRDEINEVYQQVVNAKPQPFGCAFVVLWRVENYKIDTDYGDEYGCSWWLEGLVDMSKILGIVAD